MLSTTTLQHVRVELALHHLQDGDGTPLLLLHGLGEHTGSTVPIVAHHWPGPIWGLDFTGHGQSTVPVGGGYTPEALMSDADAALSQLGPSTILGRGLGGYVGLLLAGSRPAEVRGLVITDGPGLDGGGSEPQSSRILEITLNDAARQAPDPWALLELSSDVRPIDYAAERARQIGALSGRSPSVYVDAVGRPAWLRAALDHESITEGPVVESLGQLATGR
jgi:pimeloyl-ACP methyl ester carboxylesterase